ncbi:MAG: LacI family DNA-binding transcriptional regulator [Gammaproteobacteria bacterium]
MPRSTIDDVAALAGVSIKTVSRVVNREPNVRHSTRERVEAAIAELNYRPNRSARSLARRRSQLIVLVYDDPSLYDAPSAGYIVRLQEGALRACRDSGYELLIHPCNYRDKEIRTELRSLIEQARPDGLVLAAPISNIDRIVDGIAETGVPFVRLSPGDAGQDGLAIGTDDQEVSAAMTCHLAALGHRRIGFIAGNPAHRAVGNRLPGYRDGLRRSGLEFAKELVARGDNSIASGEAAAETLLALADPPTAIFAANDDMAAGVLRVAYRHGLRVPGQLSVAGFDDSALARQVYPALTTIRQPLASMAEQAARALTGLKNGAAPPGGSRVVPSSLEIRDSTGPAPA